VAAGRKNHLLAGWLVETGMTKPVLAEAIRSVSAQLTGHAMTVSLRTIERWINGGDRPREPLPGIVAAAIGQAAGLELSSGHLGWPVPGNQISDTGGEAQRLSRADERQEEPPVIRRNALRILLAGTVVAITDDHRRALEQARSLMDTTLAGSASTTGAIGVWEAQAWAFGSGYGGKPPTELLSQVVAEFLDVQTVLDRPLTGSQRTRLTDVAARLAGLTAVILHDLGEHAQAVAWFTTGTNASKKANDDALTAWLLARSAMIDVNYGLPKDAVAKTRRAQAALGRSATAPAALAAAVQARGFALMGRPQAAHDALNLADDLFEHLPDADRAETWWGYEEQKHLVHASHALTAIGETSKANDVQVRALALTKKTSHLTRTLLQLDAATCQVKDGAVGDGAAAATTALTGLPGGFSSGLVAARATAVDHVIPAAARRNAEVTAFRSLLA
jgi:tetratricopeptide (TPR) repeat protein